MTETTETKKTLPPSVERFVLSWGDMGGQWGVNRSVAQIHALLYLSPVPLTAEEISDQLAIARSNVSTSIKELLAWGLVRRVPVRGDRRDHFEAEPDIWEIVTRIAVGRKAREIDPILAVLKTCAEVARGDRRLDPVVSGRLNEMLAFTTSVDRWFTQVLSLPRGKLKTLLKLGARVGNLLPAKSG